MCPHSVTYLVSEVRRFSRPTSFGPLLTNFTRALLTSELVSVFSQAPRAPNSVTNPRVREAFLRATGQLAESSTAAANSKKRIPGEEDSCPICYDTMFRVSEAYL